MHFGPWHSIDEAVEHAPDGGGIVQLRAEAIYAYARGQSAMVYYTSSAGHASLRALMERNGADIVADARRHGACFIRFGETEQPERELARLLRSFELRFGSLPIGNVALAPTVC